MLAKLKKINKNIETIIIIIVTTISLTPTLTRVKQQIKYLEGKEMVGIIVPKKKPGASFDVSKVLADSVPDPFKRLVSPRPA